MKIRFLLNEAIDHTPVDSNLKRTYKIIYRRYLDVQKAMTDLDNTIIKCLKEEYEYMFKNRGWRIWDDEEELQDIITRIKDNLYLGFYSTYYRNRIEDHISDMKDNLDYAYEEDNSYNRQVYIKRFITYFGYLHEYATEYNSKENIEDALQKDFTDQITPFFYKEEFIPPIIKAYKILLEANLRFIKLLENFKPKFKELERLMSVYRREDQKPSHESIELLYHTSIDATKLFREGFKQASDEIPENRGLGGSQSLSSGHYGEKAISFTSNLYVAKEIMRCLREAILISKGEIRLHQIIQWAKKEGVLEHTKELYFSSEGQLGKNGTHFQRRGPEFEALVFYTKYLWASEERYNPVFFGLADLFNYAKNKSTKDVGILKCKVDLSDDSKYDYMRAMDEWRVLPSQVIEIVGIID